MNFQEKLANALERTIKLSKKNGSNIFKSNEISRADREILLKTHWIEPIVKGWYMTTRPNVREGESSVWFACFWKFVSKYLSHNYKDNFCLSAESSIDVHTESPTIPRQVVVILSKKGGKSLDLPFKTSLLSYYDPKDISDEKIEMNGLQIMKLGYALCKTTPCFFENDPQKLEIAMRLIRSADEILEPLLKYGMKSAAKRLIGGYRFLGKSEIAKELEEGLAQFGVIVKPENPFNYPTSLTNSRTKTPTATRIFALWKQYREVIIETLPPPPGIPNDKKLYFDKLEEIYKEDAYNSLSIEGFEVDETLIEKVKLNQWDPGSSEDNETKNALAAKGYYEAFKEVRISISKILEGANSGHIIEKDLSKWYQKIFSPSVHAGILRPHDLIGYRRSQVYIKGSRHVPLSQEKLLDAMETFFTCLKEEPHAGVRAILGHFIFVYIHPYMDGNGRIGRFLMNAMFASGGYPWTIIHVKNRKQYLASLEKASVENDIKSFVDFIVKEMQ